MRIGVMLRTLDEQGGVGVYTRNIVDELLKIDQHNQYIFFYRRRENLGRYADDAKVTERYVWGHGKPMWDQVAIPLACRREKIDVLFHPKFTAPFLAPCSVVMVVHGADWFLPEQAQFYGTLDVWYNRMFLPWYIRRCATVISVSQLTTDNFNEALSLRADKMKTVYFAPARHFRQVTETEALARVRERYALPERFILTLTKRTGGERKNLRNLIEAYARYHAAAEDPWKLVVGGKDCHLFSQDYSIPEDGYGSDILFPGWIDQGDMPSVYSLAGLYLYPSRLESASIPVMEAMFCGTPLVTSDANDLRVISGGAAVLVDPENVDEIAAAIGRVLGDPDLRAEMVRLGLERSKFFSWDACARETLAILQAAAGNS